LVSQSDPSSVEEVRQEERARGGGPSAPRYSFNFHVVTIALDLTIDNDTETRQENLSADFVNVEDGQVGRDYRDQSGIWLDYQEDVFDDFYGVPSV